MITLIENHHMLSNWFYYDYLNIKLASRPLLHSKLADKIVPVEAIGIFFTFTGIMKDKLYANMPKEICPLRIFSFRFEFHM